jgi:hypothetical protein
VSRRRRILIVAGLLVEPIALWLRGYPIGGRVIVRCRQGHLFTTLWVPSVSVKSIRLLWWRVQRCPVGEHWTVVKPVRDGEISESERRAARHIFDIPVP